LFPQIAALQGSSRGWFLSDEEFQSMADLDINEAKAKYAAKAKKQASGGAAKKPASLGGGTSGASKASTASSAGGKYTASSTNAWSTIGVKKAVPQPSKKAGGGAKGSFAAAFGNEDSDGDDDN
jgi:hypothetical protein